MSSKEKLSLSVQGMSCASCVGRVERGLSEIEGITDVTVNLATETAHLTADTAEQALDAITKLRKMGYSTFFIEVGLLKNGIERARYK